MKTFTATPADIDKTWTVIDAKGVVLGRLASIVAMRLRGKHKPTFTPHMDMGDNVIVINADKVQLTGNKRQEKHYWHTGHPGGIKSRTNAQILEGRHPERVVMLAVKRMLPGNKLSRQLMTNLRIYAGAEHPHTAQNPATLDVAAMNPQEHQGSLSMADEIKSLDELNAVVSGTRPADAAMEELAAPRGAGARRVRSRLRHRQAKGRGGPRLDPARQRQGDGERQGREGLLRGARCCGWCWRRRSASPAWRGSSTWWPP